MLADGITPVGLYRTLVGAEGVGFILESVDQQGRWARYSFVGRRPLGELRAEREKKE
jgi:anthranilate synthase component 1